MTPKNALKLKGWLLAISTVIFLVFLIGAMKADQNNLGAVIVGFVIYGGATTILETLFEKLAKTESEAMEPAES